MSTIARVQPLAKLATPMASKALGVSSARTFTGTTRAQNKVLAAFARSRYRLELDTRCVAAIGGSRDLPWFKRNPCTTQQKRCVVVLLVPKFSDVALLPPRRCQRESAAAPHLRITFC